MGRCDVARDRNGQRVRQAVADHCALRFFRQKPETTSIINVIQRFLYYENSM